MEKSKDICYEMLLARGYTITNDKRDQGYITARTPKNIEVYVFFIDEPKLNMSTVKFYYYIIYKENIRHCIFVYANTITTSVKKTLCNIYNTRVELFKSNELQYNITKHSLVPSHTVITKTDEHSECSKYPILKRSDAIAKYYGFMSGELIRVDRLDGSICYRIVK